MAESSFDKALVKCKDALKPFYDVCSQSDREYSAIPNKYLDLSLRYQLYELGKNELPSPFNNQVTRILAVCPWGPQHRVSVLKMLERFPDLVPKAPKVLSSLKDPDVELKWKTIKSLME